jgi:hypothetical protein
MEKNIDEWAKELEEELAALAVRVRLEGELSLLARSLDHACKARSRERCAALRREYERRLGILFTLKPP